MKIICPYCEAEIEIEVIAPSPPSGRNWKRLALLALAVVLVVGACVIVYWMR